LRLDRVGVTLPGLEGMLCDELAELGFSARPILPGKVLLSSDEEGVVWLNYCSRLAHRFVILLADAEIDPRDLSSVGRAAFQVDWSSWFSPDRTFAVRAVRVGEHSFRSPDVAAEVGAAVVRHFLSSCGRRIRANLRRPDVLIRAYVSGRRMLLGIDTTGESLHRRGYRRYQHRASLSPTIGYALVRLTGWLSDPEGEVLVDPMCGGGTIPIEAVLAARRIPPGSWRRGYPIGAISPLGWVDQSEVFSRADEMALRDLRPAVRASDVSPKHVAGAMVNALSAGAADSIDFTVADAADLARAHPRLSALATNPPYELRTGRNRRLPEVFSKMAEALSSLLSLRACFIVGGPAMRKLEEAMSALRREVSIRVLYGGVEARILAYSVPPAAGPGRGPAPFLSPFLSTFLYPLPSPPLSHARK